MILGNFVLNFLFSTFNSASGGWTQISKIINIFNTFLMLLIIFGLVIFRTKLYVKTPKRAIKYVKYWSTPISEMTLRAQNQKLGRKCEVKFLIRAQS